MAHPSNGNPVPKLYQSIIEDVIDGVHELFMEEGIDEQVLKELKQLWESKVLQSKAVEGFFRDSHSPQFVLQLPQNLHQTLPGSTASIVIPAGRTIQNFTAELGTSRASTTFTLPPGISYPIQVPSGVTLQTASGHLYKVNVPVMVTQAPGGYRILQQPVRHILQQQSQSAGQNSILHRHGTPMQATLPQKLPSQQPRNMFQPSGARPVLQEKGIVVHRNAQNVSAAGYSSVQQAAGPQQQGLIRNLLIQQNVAADDYEYESVHPSPTNEQLSGFSQDSENGQDIRDLTALQQSLQDRMSTDSTPLMQQPISDDIVELLLLNDDPEENHTMTGQNNTVPSIPQQRPAEVPPLECDTGIKENFQIVIDDIIQIDGTYDSSSDEEVEYVRDVEDSEFLGIINAEDLKALEEEEEDSSSSEDSTSNSDEEHKIEIEEDPLNSGDDVSEQEVPDLFDTDNVIVCQYDKIHRSKNKWKFYLKDGVMSFGGKDYVFSKAIGEAEW